MLIVDLNKLSDDNLASELVGNRNFFFKPSKIEEIVIFMIREGNT